MIYIKGPDSILSYPKVQFLEYSYLSKESISHVHMVCSHGWMDKPSLPSVGPFQIWAPMGGWVGAEMPRMLWSAFVAT